MEELLFANFAKRNIAKFIDTHLLNSLESKYHMFSIPITAVTVFTPPQTRMHQTLSFVDCRGDLRLVGWEF